MEEQTGAGTDVRSVLMLRFGLQPAEKETQSAAAVCRWIRHLRNKNIRTFSLSRGVMKRDVPLWRFADGISFCARW